MGQSVRKAVKICHTVAAGGLIGGLSAEIVLLSTAEISTVDEFVWLRGTITAIGNYVLLPSLAIGLISGFLSMIVHRPFMDAGWAWIKAAIGILMFKGILTIIGDKAAAGERLSQEIAAGASLQNSLKAMMSYEWATLWVVLGISVANVVIGVWRPRIMPRPGRAARPSLSEAQSRGFWYRQR